MRLDPLSHSLRTIHAALNTTGMHGIIASVSA